MTFSTMDSGHLMSSKLYATVVDSHCIQKGDLCDPATMSIEVGDATRTFVKGNSELQFRGTNLFFSYVTEEIPKESVNWLPQSDRLRTAKLKSRTTKTRSRHNMEISKTFGSPSPKTKTSSITLGLEPRRA